MPPWPSSSGGTETTPPWFAPLFVLFLLLLFAIFGLQHYRNGKPMLEFWKFSAFFLVPTLFIVVLDVNTLRYITKHSGAHFTQQLVAGVVIGTGWGAYHFKQQNQLWYGYVEVFFGTAYAIAVVSRSKFAAVEFTALTFAQYAALLGCAYVVARGLTNIHDAKQSARRANP